MIENLYDNITICIILSYYHVGFGDFADVVALKAQLIACFNQDDWTSTQHDTYRFLSNLIRDERIINRIKQFESKDDKNIIRGNFKEQPWFIYSKSKPIITQLIEQMKPINYHYNHVDGIFTHLLIDLDFGRFTLHGYLYHNDLNHMTSTHIYFENRRHQKAYLTYYTHLDGFETPDNLKGLKLPEFDKIYQISNLSQSIIYQCDLLNFFAEIIIYYDDSNQLGELPISHQCNVTLNQLIEQCNQYISQKKSNADYQVIQSAPTPKEYQ